jgi:hypothetical protein
MQITMPRSDRHLAFLAFDFGYASQRLPRELA